MSRRTRTVRKPEDVAQPMGSALQGSERISRREFWALGGLAHPRLWRRQRGKAWQHYYRHN